MVEGTINLKKLKSCQINSNNSQSAREKFYSTAQNVNQLHTSHACVTSSKFKNSTEQKSTKSHENCSFNAKIVSEKLPQPQRKQKKRKQNATSAILRPHTANTGHNALMHSKLDLVNRY